MSTEDITTPAGNVTKERLYGVALFLCAALSVVVTISIIFVLARDAIDFFGIVSPADFFTGTDWVIRSSFEASSYGVLPLVSGTIIVTVVSAAIALPVGVAAAVYLSEYATTRARAVLKPALEVLAGIPTVVYGYFALVYVTPFFQALGVPLGTFNALSASVMVGIMIIPMVSSLSEDAMSSVPDSLRQAGYGLGATKYEVSTGIVIPAALSGIFSSFILALSRAIGETMIVAVAMGSNPQLLQLFDPAANLVESNQPMTAAMIQLVTSDVGGGGPAYKAMFAIGLTLFVITFLMNLASNRIAARYKEDYE